MKWSQSQTNKTNKCSKSITEEKENDSYSRKGSMYVMFRCVCGQTLNGPDWMRGQKPRRESEEEQIKHHKSIFAVICLLKKTLLSLAAELH